ncbi:ferredoxin family protein [Thermosinus carboxydivorans]|uniref:ferredoxin family protein n=1 Tax=Thermosinus carboxydivorans TaxID=261685 RepID=UPI0002D3E724|nr:4Fe-4S dicluster domain-containing protein [Thermosinus carboxydivorans]
MSNLAELDAKLKLLLFKTNEDWQHVVINDQEVCRNCTDKQCLTICPSGVFRWNYQPADPILVLYKQCIECGSCRLVCPANNINFSYPNGGYGVSYKEG